MDSDGLSLQAVFCHQGCLQAMNEEEEEVIHGLLDPGQKHCASAMNAKLP